MHFKSGWKSFGLGTYRPCDATYCLFPYESLSPLPEEQFRGAFQWLEDITMNESLDPPTECQELLEREDEDDSADEREVIMANDVPARLEHLVASAQQLGLTLPPAFLHFMASPELQARIPSCTACYFDLAEHIVLCLGSEDGYLLRFLNDQQSVLTWYLYMTPQNEHCVLVSGYWLGEISDSAYERPLRKRDRRAARAHIFVCAPSFEAFLYRFWLENVIWYKLHASEPKRLIETEQRYIDHCAMFHDKEDKATPDDEDEDLLLLRETVEKELQAAGWEKDDDAGGWHYQSDAVLLRIFCQMVIQPVFLLALTIGNNEPFLLRKDICVLLRIECQEDTGVNFLLQEIIALQKDIFLQNYQQMLQDLVSVHSDEISFKRGDDAWHTASATDHLVFAEQREGALQAETAAMPYWYNEGIDHKMQGDHQKAAEAFQKAAEQAPVMAEAWHNLGFSRLALDQTEQGIHALAMAAKAYSRRLECYPYNAYNCFWLACVFSLLKEKERTLEYLARAIALNPDYQDEAEYEEDLEWLRQDEDFLHLIEA